MQFKTFIISILIGNITNSVAFADCVVEADKKINLGSWSAAFNILKPCAEAKNIEAQMRLGALYSLPQAGQKDEELAFFWTERAAKSGSAQALFNLASFHETEANGLTKDLKNLPFIIT